MYLFEEYLGLESTKLGNTSPSNGRQPVRSGYDNLNNYIDAGEISQPDIENYKTGKICQKWKRTPVIVAKRDPKVQKLK